MKMKVLGLDYASEMELLSVSPTDFNLFKTKF